MADESGSDSAVDGRVSTAATVAYWNGIPATVDGMLDGYALISNIDLRSSLNFIERLRRSRQPPGQSTPPADRQWIGRAADCGAGIGRITRGALMKVCKTVDLVEPVAKFADEARATCAADPVQSGQLGNVYVTGLEDWRPEELSFQYDLIWLQWCLCYLNNDALLQLLQRCRLALEPGGWIVVKENISSTVDVYSARDSSVTRTELTFLNLFKQAGLKLVRTEAQKGFPKFLGRYNIRCYALQPAS